MFAKKEKEKKNSQSKVLARSTAINTSYFFCRDRQIKIFLQVQIPLSSPH